MLNGLQLNNPFNTRLVVLLAAALGIRVVAGWWLGHFSAPVSWEYDEIANNLLSGRGFVYERLGTPYRALVLPAYPLFCAAVYALTGHSQTILLLLQCLLGAYVCLQVRSIGLALVHDDRIATTAAWLVALHPGLIVYASFLHTFTLDLVVFLWVVLCWLRLVRDPTWPVTCRTGLSSGIAVLSRGTIVPFLVIASAWFARYGSLPRGETAGRLAVIVIVAGILVSPWFARNAVVLGSFPVYQTSASESLWKGNNPLASGSLYLADGRSVLDAAPAAFQRQLRQLDELGKQRLFRDEALRFIWENPRLAAELGWNKFLAFWWFSDESGSSYPASYLEWYRVSYTAVVVFAIAGAWRIRGALVQPAGLLLLAYGLSIALVQSLYYVEGRHRWSVEPLLLVLSAAGGLMLWEALMAMAHRWRKPVGIERL